VARARHGVLKAAPEAAPLRDRLHQLADAMHDEGDLRAVPAAARRSGHRHRLLQPDQPLAYVFSCFNQDQPLDVGPETTPLRLTLAANTQPPYNIPAAHLPWTFVPPDTSPPHTSRLLRPPIA
jgi:hypothetical protein